jgi:hypothetical protein
MRFLHRLQQQNKRRSGHNPDPFVVSRALLIDTTVAPCYEAVEMSTYPQTRKIETLEYFFAQA